MNETLSTLTDFEEIGLTHEFNLADGHAYQDLHPAFHPIVQTLPEIWNHTAKQSIPEAKQSFNESYASFINAPLLPNFSICPTASNSIDLIGAVLNHLKFKVALIEPTFDNLALLLKRRGVHLHAIQDTILYQAAEHNNIDEMFPELKKQDALFIVHPNNPTGLVFSETAFKNILSYCKKYGLLLIIDNCFRAYRRASYCDYNLLLSAEIPFIAFEDTGKVWPTQDLKASLIYYSDDIKAIFHEIYNEVYLCVSNFSLGILSAFFNATAKAGLKNTIWDVIDTRRAQLRTILENTHLSVSQESEHSHLPVEWLNIDNLDQNDFTICQELRQHHLAVLPGRQFYWNSPNDPNHQRNIRVSLMKREQVFLSGIAILKEFGCQFNEMNMRTKHVNTLHDRAWV